MAFPVPQVPHYQQLIAALSQQMAAQQQAPPSLPHMIRPGFRALPGQPGIAQDPQEAAPPQWDWFSGPDGSSMAPPPAPDDPTVFHAMRRALPAATRSAQTSHKDALIQRFMQNARGVRK